MDLKSTVEKVAASNPTVSEAVVRKILREAFDALHAELSAVTDGAVQSPLGRFVVSEVESKKTPGTKIQRVVLKLREKVEKPEGAKAGAPAAKKERKVKKDAGTSAD